MDYQDLIIKAIIIIENDIVTKSFQNIQELISFILINDGIIIWSDKDIDWQQYEQLYNIKLS